LQKQGTLGSSKQIIYYPDIRLPDTFYPDKYPDTNMASFPVYGNGFTVKWD